MTNTTEIQSLVNDLVKVNGIFGLYSYAGSVDAETLISDLTGKTADELIDYLEQAGVSSTAIANFETILSQSDFTSVLTSLRSTYNGGLYTNINEGNSSLTGGTGNDLIINIDDITSSLTGNAGNDLLINAGSASSTLKGGDGDDVLANLSTASSTLEGGNGNDILVNFSTATSKLYGDAGSDILLNFDTSAQLYGGNGADVLVSSYGNDTLIGGNGNDTMTGGDGSDVFQLSASRSFNFSSFSFKWTTSGSDVIKDFSVEDKIQIDTNSLGLLKKSDFKFENGKLYVDNQVLATLDGVTSFNTNNIEFI